MDSTAVLFPAEQNDTGQERMVLFLSSEDGYWLENDVWRMDAQAFKDAGIKTIELKKHETKAVLADFTGYRSGLMKLEMKYVLLRKMKSGELTALSIYRNYSRAVRNIGIVAESDTASLMDLRKDVFECMSDGMSSTEKRVLVQFAGEAAGFISYDVGGRTETDKDTWRGLNIPGAKLSATSKRTNKSMSFAEIPGYYRPMVKRFMKRLVIKRSWSYCTELLIYLRYFFRVFYESGYTDGFLEELSREDIEKYLAWVARDYKDKNATFRSKAVSFIRWFIDYIQLSEYEEAPRKDVYRLIFDDDIPKRERAEDTMSKVRYIPGPVLEQLDACIHEIDPPEMLPVYILLRETGWRGTDVLNLRYDTCLDYVWNDKEKQYVPYLCGEITKTGIPMLKIPLRHEISGMVKNLVREAVKESTEYNNPERYLFNTYKGKNRGLPYSRPRFSAAVQALINKKKILDADGKLYHFRAHSLRHTRASEYIEQGMPIGVIQQILGHCSLQMTLHYAKVSENKLYETWKKTESLGLLSIKAKRPGEAALADEGCIRYERVRKNLDAVKVPFGTCFKPSKLGCRQQMNHCLECGSFCSCEDDIPEYEAEIKRIREKIDIGTELGRDDWVEKNSQYLLLLESMVDRIRREKVVHKNGGSREVTNG